MSELRPLIEKLDNNAKNALEKAASLCLKHGHYNIEIEHWLLAVEQSSDSDFMAEFEHYNVDRSKLTHDLHLQLGNYPTGNDATPAISPRVIDMIKEAWSLASLEMNTPAISNGILCLALIKNTVLHQVLLTTSSCFKDFEFVQIKQLVKSISLPNNDEKTVVTKNNITSPALSTYTLDLNAQALQGQLNEAIGREDEVQKMIDILCRHKQNNAMLTGEPGVGKRFSRILCGCTDPIIC